MPYALARSHSNASREWAWPWLRPQQNRLDMMRRPDSAKHLSKPAQLIRIIQDLLGHKAVSTTMFYTHVLNRAPPGGTEPRGSCVAV